MKLTDRAIIELAGEQRRIREQIGALEKLLGVKGAYAATSALAAALAALENLERAQ